MLISPRITRRIGWPLGLALLALLSGAGWWAQPDSPEGGRRLWNDQDLKDWATPLAGLNERPGFYSEKEYYAAPVDNLRTYPVYHPKFEPPNYRQSLLERGPQPLIEPEKLRTKEDWIRAGQQVFEELDTAICRTADPAAIAYITDAASIDAHRDESHDAMTKDGVLLDYRWVVDKDRTLKLSVSSCAGCHSRLMPDGTLLRGAPCNFDMADSPAADALLAPFARPPRTARGAWFYDRFGVPWLRDDPHLPFKNRTDEEMKVGSPGTELEFAL